LQLLLLILLIMLSSSSSILSHVNLGFEDGCSLRCILYCSEYPPTILHFIRIAAFIVLCINHDDIFAKLGDPKLPALKCSNRSTVMKQQQQ
jgi:hypothetical protein